ncbi:hypothetical protein ACF1BQ_032840 [Bradyrhizobium sp. RDT10]|uniref:hypothetical protein n=1 Tax=Bradyrhizobium TaxID=374 RepID=UPI0011AEB5D9|nr:MULTISPECIES: hypothetical protein [Bradyrhizobium]MBT1516764.1 hypothetical protein [Bradyrhizobium sp. SRL28]
MYKAKSSLSTAPLQARGAAAHIERGQTDEISAIVHIFSPLSAAGHSAHNRENLNRIRAPELEKDN